MAASLVVRAGLTTAIALAAGACAQTPKTTASIVKVSYSSVERECLARAMYFESHRGSDEGMLAVGSVVANRVKSGAYGATYCDVVGQKRQFAQGVMTRTMDGDAAERARRAADAVLAGKRHPALKGAMFFHTAGLRFPYPNMRYVLVAGGNAFYEKRSIQTMADARENARSRAMALAYAKTDPTGAAKPIMIASLEPQQQVQPAASLAPAAVAVTTTVAPPVRSVASAVPTAAPVRAAVPVQVAAVAPAPVRIAVAQSASRPAQALALASTGQQPELIVTPRAATARAAETAPARPRQIALVEPVQASTFPAAKRPAAPTRVHVAKTAPAETPAAEPARTRIAYAPVERDPVADAFAAFADTSAPAFAGQR